LTPLRDSQLRAGAPREIVAREQLPLSAWRCLQLAASSLRHRWFRCSITIAILGLAVAFLVHTLCFGVLAGYTRRSAERELSQSRRWGELLTRLGTADSAAEVERALGLGDPERMAEYRRFAGPSVDLDEASESARSLARLARFLRDLPAAPRSVLQGDRNLEQLWSALAVADERARFSERLASFRLHLPGLTREGFEQLLTLGWPRLRAASAAIARGHQLAIDQLRARFDGRSPTSLVLDPPPDLAAALAQAGFGLTASELGSLGDRTRSASARSALQRLLLDASLRNSVAQAGAAQGLRLRPSQLSLEALEQALPDAAHAAWLAQLLGAREPALAVSGERLYEWLQSWQRESRWTMVAGGGVSAEGVAGEAAATAGVAAGATGEGAAPLPGDGARARTLWLVALSFLVCSVGVANAMFMSVTERFSEIATMKCLGALDGVVLLLFLFEAVLQGLAGGLIGVLLGLALALGRGLLEFGPLLSAAWAGRAELLAYAAGCLSAGVLLSALSALGPAWVAARLLPMEAMRVD